MISVDRVLGGTERPLLLRASEVAGAPTLDTRALHVAAIVERLAVRGSRCVPSVHPCLGDAVATPRATTSWSRIAGHVFRALPSLQRAARGAANPQHEVIVMRVAGILLIIVGIIGLVWGGITYTRRKDTVSVGPISATVRQRETFPISPVVGGIALVAGIALLAAGGRRRG